MKNKNFRKILISIIISVMLINLIYMNFGKVFAAGAHDSDPNKELGGGTTGGISTPAGQQNNNNQGDQGSQGEQGEQGAQGEQGENKVPLKTLEPGVVADNAGISNMIKEAIAKWYYIMRLIVIAFMLVLLIFVGIKMAWTTVASEKAVYKQMLIDWVAGMIIVFSIHYIMVFILNLNDNIVEALRPLSTEKADIQEEYEYGAEENKKTSSEIETTLYESARTRAYSLKFSDGFTGMIIYGVLVWYAWRYALMYFKRLINVIILTLLAPAVSASYAFNKVLTGKAKIFSTWLSEFIMTVVVQTVHVLMYVTFVRTILVLSLQSLPGVILAIVILNFMIKADGILRRIFKLSGGSGSLAGDMTDRSTFQDLKQDIQGVANVMIGGKITKEAAKLTYRVATKPIRAVAEKKFGDRMEELANSEEYRELQKKKFEGKIEENNEAYQYYRQTLGLDKKQESIMAEIDNLAKQAKNVKSEEDLQKIIQQISENEKKQDELEKEEKQSRQDFLKYYQDTQTIGEAMQDGVDQLLSPYAYTRAITVSELKKYEELKALTPEEFKEQYKQGKITRAQKEMFKEFQKLEAKGKLKLGYRRKIKTQRAKSEEYAPWRGMFGKKSDSIGSRFFNNMKLRNMLGLTADEAKILNAQAKFYKQSIKGIMCGIAGWAMLGSNFMLGAGLLATSASAKGEMRRRRAASRNRLSYKNHGTYKFKAFSKGTEAKIHEEAVKASQVAQSEMARRTAQKHPKLANKILNGSMVIVKPIITAGIVVSGVSLGVPLQGARGNQPKKYSGSLRPRLTFMEDDKLAAIHDKALRENFKYMQQKFISENIESLEKDFSTKFSEYQKFCEEQAKNKEKSSLLIQEALASENTVVVQGEKGTIVIKVKDDSAIGQLVESANKTDSISNMTRDEKVKVIRSDILKHETELIEDAILRICAQKGISDVANLELTESSNIQIKEEIIGALEKRGIIQKGEITFSDKVISEEKINTVFEGMVQDNDKKEKANLHVSEKIVQEAILEYMARNGISDKKILQDASVKTEIYDIIKEKMMSESSKSSGDVIASLTGKNKVKDAVEISDTIKELVDSTASSVRTHDLLKTEDSETSSELMDKLVERDTTRKINSVKTSLEKAVHTGEEDLELALYTEQERTSESLYTKDGRVNEDAQRRLELLFDLKGLEEQNKAAEKAGRKSNRKGSKERIAAKLEYYAMEDGSRKFDSSKDGSRKFDSSKDGSRRVAPEKDGSIALLEDRDGNKDVSKRMKKLETRLYGQVDVVNLINQPVKNEK